MEKAKVKLYATGQGLYAYNGTCSIVLFAVNGATRFESVSTAKINVYVDGELCGNIYIKRGEDWKEYTNGNGITTRFYDDGRVVQRAR